MLHLIKAGVRVGGRIIGAYFSWIRKYAKNKDKYSFQERYLKVRDILQKVSKALDVEPHVQDVDKIPSETCLIVSNHLSAFDPVLMISSFDKPCTFVAKKELEKAPFAGKVITGIDGLFLDRKDLKQSLRLMMKVEEDLKKKEKNWIIFPEGTRNKDENHLIADFHHGTFRPAVKAGVPIVPVAIYGTFRVLKKKPLFKKYPVFLKVLDPIYPEEYKNLSTQEIADLVKDKIQQVVSFELRALDHKEMLDDPKYHFNEII